jgi:hypothetical protein
VLRLLADLFRLPSTARHTKVVPPVDLNIPVTNPKLVDAIQRHQQLQQNETALALLEELRRSFLLAAIILERPLTETAPGQLLFKKGDRIGMVEARDDENSRLLALFTDHDQLNRFTNQANSSQVMPAKDALSFVLERGYTGTIINPAGASTLRLDAPFIRTVIDGM